MAKTSKLLSALAAEKGVDIKKVLQKRKAKENSRKARRAGLPDTRNLKKPQPQKKKAQVDDAELESDDDDEDWEEEESDEDEEMGGLIDDEAEEGDSDDEEESDEEGKIDLAKFEHDESSSDSEIEMEEKIERPKKGKQATDLPKPKADKTAVRKAAKGAAQSDSEEEEDDEEDSDIDLEDLEEDLDDEEREDLVPHTRTTINNHTALLAALSRISLPTDKSVPFATHQSVVSSKPTSEGIDDIQDDLKRELAFYAQALEAAKLGRTQLIKEGVPFTRPNDYFAEMVKNDGQMEKVKAKLVEEATAKKAAAEARKQRDLKKFGKQVQVAKEQERAKAKRETLEKIKTLKRKRSESGAAAGEREDIDFDVAVDNEIKGVDKKSAGKSGRDGGPNKRHKKDSKYGFGGKKRHAKSNDAQSAGDLGGFSVKRMKGTAGGAGGKGKSTPRLGKSKRKAAAGRR